jgi:hypothetical protein
LPLPFYTYQHAGLRVEIVYDERTGSPRDVDPIGTVIGWARDLKLGERQVDLECTSRDAIIADLRRDGARVILPLYYSSHGPQCRLDIGESLDDDALKSSSGVVYVTAEKLRREFAVKRITSAVLDKAKRLLTLEISDYSHYLTGAVYGYVIRDWLKDALARDYGFYGLDACESEANSIAEDCATQEEAERVEAHLMACRGIQTVRASRPASATSMILGGVAHAIQCDFRPASVVQRAALADIEGRISCIRHSLRLERRLAERLPDGSELVGVFAHLGDFADTANKPIPVSVQIGTVTITPRGETTLKLTLSTQTPLPTHAG